MNDQPVLPFASAAEWEEWLAENHETSQGLWLKLAKKSAGVPTVTYAEALEAALCYGWIDGQKNKFDDAWWLQKFTPRRARSPWSKINHDKAEELISAGRMQPAGLREVERARADGRWDDPYQSQSKIPVPPDFQAALDANPAAKSTFAELDKANRYAFLYRIVTVKKAETRQKRIEQYVEMLAAGETIHPKNV